MIANSLVGQGSAITTIGAVAYEAKSLLYWFITSPGSDAIIEYNESSGQMARVLE